MKKRMVVSMMMGALLGSMMAIGAATEAQAYMTTLNSDAELIALMNSGHDKRNEGELE